jgi:GTP pyrophosphokinase
MVTVTRPDLPASDDPDALSAGLPEEERRLVERARAYAQGLYGEQRLGTGESAYEHALGIGRNAAALRLDAHTRAAGLLFAAPSYVEHSDEKLNAEFGAVVASLVGGIARLNTLRVVTRTVAQSKESPSQSEVLRKMLLAMVQDIRVVLLRLASRTQTMHYLVQAPEETRREIARETLDIYAPLANRLGVWQLKWELEDLSFRHLEPALYKKIAGMLDERRGEREQFIADAIAQLHSELGRADIESDVAGRPKHIYSIYNKMRTKSLDFSEVHDVRGLRVLVEDVKDCYTALGVVHNLWTPIPREFDDYISRPKDNFYRSLHTAVIGPDGRPLEVQIRTQEMHRHAELGVAAHWRYKEGVRREPGKGDPFDDKIAWLRQVLAWRDDIVDASDWREQTKHAALDDTVYVITPQGRVVDLPQGSTPVDFAYALHTDVGHRCRGAKVNGSLVPLDARLENGDRVEITIAKQGGPSRDWLNPELGYIHSGRARNKVRQWFNSQELEQTIAAGRATVERELHREGKRTTKLDDLAQQLGYGRADDLFAAVGREEVGARAVQQALRNDAPAEAPPAVTTHQSRAGETRGILVVGVDRLMTQLARCCKPAPPDGIVGFVTKGRGVSIHRHDCPSLARMVHDQPERRITADWGNQKDRVFPVDIMVRANDREGLLRDVSEVLTREKINVTGVNTHTRRGIASMSFTVEVDGVDHLRRALAMIEDVRGVFLAARR